MTAALFHDTGFIKKYENNESISAEIAKTNLFRYGYSQQDIDIITNCILSTKMPQNSQTRLQKIMCDADLDHLGRDDFFEKGDLLRKEWQIFRKKMYNDEQWYKLQLKFLEEHEYFTISAKKLRNRGKLKNIEHLKKLIIAK